MNLFNLFAKLSLNTEDYEKGLDKSQKQAQSFSSKIGTAFKAGAKAIASFGAVAVAGAGALAALTVKTSDYIGEIDDMAQRLGMSTTEYQEWAYAVQLSGAQATTFQTSIRFLTEKVKQLSEGNGDALLTLEELGIGYEDFMALDTAGQFGLIVNSLQGVEDYTDKARIAQELFGNRAYQELMPLLNMEQGSIEELKQKTKDLGLVMCEDAVQAGAEFGDTLDTVRIKIKNMASTIFTDFIPELTNITTGLTDMANGVDGATDKVVDGIVGMTNRLIDKLPEFLDTAVDLVLQIVDGLLLHLPAIVQKLTDLV